MGELILKIFVENKDLSELKKRERYGIVSGIVGRKIDNQRMG